MTMNLRKNEFPTSRTLAEKLMVAGLLALAACSETVETPKVGLSLQVRAPQNPDDNPFNLPDAAFVVLAAEGVNAPPSVQPYHPGMKLDLPDVPFGAGRQIRVEVWSKNAAGQPVGPVLGRGISAPIDVSAGATAQIRHPYVTRINRFAPPMTDDGSTSTLDSGGAGQCAVTLPSGQILFIGGAAGKSGVTDPYAQANWTNFSPSAVGYDPDSRGSILLDFAKLSIPRAFHSCAVGSSAVAVVGGLGADDKGNPVPLKQIEYFDMTANLAKQENPFRQVATGTAECPSCTTGLVFARSGASVVRMFEDDNYFLILGGKGDDSTFPCLDGQKNEVACAANTWEVWHPKRGNLAQGLLNKARWNHATVRIPTPTGGYALLIGGENESGALADFEVLQFNNKGQVSSKNSSCEAGQPTCVGLDDGLWKPLTTAMPTTRVLPGAAYVTSPAGTKPDKLYNYVVIAGGFSDAAKTKVDNTIDVFDIIGGGYKNIPGDIQMVMGRGAPMVSVVTSGSRTGQVLIAGGSTKLVTGDTPYDAEFLFFTDGAVNKDIIHPVENGLGGSRTLGNAIALTTGHVLIGGGVDIDNLAARTSLLLWNPY